MAKSEEMIDKIPNHSVRVTRDGKSVRVKPNTVAGFTKDEIEEIERIAPGTFRDPVNEAPAKAKTAGKDDAKAAGKDDAKAAGKDDAKAAGKDDAKAAGKGDDL